MFNLDDIRPEDGTPSPSFKSQLKERLEKRHRELYGRPAIRGAVSRRRQMLAAALCVLTIFTLNGGFQSGMAFGERLITRMSAAITISNEPPPPADPDAPRVFLQDRLVSFAEAQAAVAFPILTPAYLPDGYALQETAVISSPVEDTIVRLTYGGARFIDLRESKPSTPLMLNMSRDVVIEQADVNGEPAVFYDPDPQGLQPGLTREQRGFLVWEHDGRWFELSGPVGLEELLKVARSIR